ncbi:hypothetical protein KUTeg_024914 [Tegillarca granosa]|uniref:Uncharacterized protein n=1 Tax=Tegillarca granosa TaxID=220873 RepID=A0ABQ9DYT5_TEGGR|nr:hypothetical protein KUTeg_024914 [Tegillarca granosa]
MDIWSYKPCIKLQHQPSRYQKEAFEICRNKMQYVLLSMHTHQTNCVQQHVGDGSLKKLKDFNFKDCGGKIAHAHSLMVTPDPLQFPGTFNLGFNVSVTADLESPLQIILDHVHIQTYVLLYNQLTHVHLSYKKPEFHANVHTKQEVQIISPQDFSFKDCGGKIAHAYSLTVSPDPLQFPGTATLSFNATLSAELKSPLQASLLIKKKVGTKFIKLPCVDMFGSV